MEKMLRSCPDIEGLYVLIREKKGTAGSERLNSIFSEKLFDRLRQSNPSCFKKVVPFADLIAYLDQFACSVSVLFIIFFSSFCLAKTDSCSAHIKFWLRFQFFIVFSQELVHFDYQYSRHFEPGISLQVWLQFKCLCDQRFIVLLNLFS